MTAILGISAFYHDSAAALVVDGKIGAAAQEERFTRKKHDHRMPVNAIQFCLKEAGIEITPDPDAKAKLDEMKFLDRNLGKTGKLALLPLLRTSSRDLWQLHMVGQQQR